MDISFVILTYNSARYIKRCLEDLSKSMQELGLEYEVFIIDNGSKDGTRELIAAAIEEFKVNVDLIKFDYNTGTTFSRNQGLKKATGKHIIIMDSDAYVNGKAIARLRNYLDENSRCGMAVPKITYPDGRFQISTDVFPTLWHKAKRFLFLKKMESQKHNADNDKIVTVDYAISAFWMFSKTVADKVGLLDEKIFYSPEDVDYCIRVWKAGYTIDYVPDVSVIHDAQELSRPKGLRINKFTISHFNGLLYLFWKHKYFFKPSKFRKYAS